MRKFFLKTAAALLFAVFSVTSAGASDDVSSITKDLQEKYSSIRTVSAHFIQTVGSVASKETQSTQGRVWFKKPGKMRWVYSTKDELISNGRLTWLYQHDLNQTIETKATGGNIATDFLSGVGDLKKDFDITVEASGNKIVTLLLKPKEPMANIKKMLLDVDKKDRLVVKTIVVDNFGATTAVSLTKIELNGPVSDGFFDYKPPRGVAIIRP